MRPKKRVQFGGAYRVKVVTIAMRGAQKSGYMAIGDVGQWIYFDYAGICCHNRQS